MLTGSPAWLATGSAATWDSSTSTLTVTGAATIIADPGSDEPNIVASGSAAQLTIAPATSPADIHFGGITLSGGARLDMASVGPLRSGSNYNVLVLGTLGASADPTLSIDSSSTLDLEDNDLIVHTGSSDHGTGSTDQLGVTSTNELAVVAGLAARGRNVAPGGILNGTWTGTGLTSSSAAAFDAGARFEQVILAVVQNSQLVLGSYTDCTVGSATESLGANDILVKYTYNGDLTLDGGADDNASSVINGLYDNGASTSNPFPLGDLNGDGLIDDKDISIFNSMYGKGVATAPTDLAASQVTATSVTLTWTGPQDAIYSVYRDGQLLATGLSATTFSDQSLSPDTAYTYSVSATGIMGYRSAHSSPLDVTTAPTAITGLEAPPVSAGQIDLSWTNTDPHATGIILERSTDGQNWTAVTPNPLPASTTSYNDTGLSENTAYYYRARATNGTAESSNDALVYAVYTQPATPTNLQAAFVSGGEIDLSWTANSNSAFYYYVEQSTDGTTWTSAGPVVYGSSANPYQAAGPFSPSTPYYFRVRGYASGGEYSEYSNVAGVNVPAIPATPSGLTATAVSDSQINLQWTDNSNNETGFTLERSTDYVNWTPVTPGPLPAGTTSYSDTGLSENTAYYYRVRAGNALGDSGDAIAYAAYTEPKAPTGFSATFVSGGEIDLTWTVNSAVAYYSVEQSTDGGATWTAEPSFVYVGGLSPGQTFTDADPGPFSPSTAYAFRVRAYSYYGQYSAYSNTASVPGAAFPAAPTNLTAAAVSDSQIGLNWADNSTDETGFILERSTDESNWASVTPSPLAAGTTSYIDGGLTDGTYYYYRVCAINTAGSSAFTDSAWAHTPYTVPTIVNPASAAQSTVTGTTDSLSVLGALPGGNESDLTYFWTMTSGPQYPYLSDNYDNSAKNMTVTFTAAGDYTFQVLIENGSASASSSVQVTVKQTLTSITVTPSPAPAILPGATQQFTAVGFDQFGLPMSPAPSITWSISSGGGTIDQTGLFTAPSQQGLVTVEATSGGVSSQMQTTVNQSIYQVTLTGRAYEPGYDASNATDGLAVSNSNWIIAASPEDAVRQAVSGTVTLNTSYDNGHSTLSFPNDLGSDFGFAILGSDDESAANQLTWDPVSSQYTGAIGTWDGDSTAPADWDFYWNVTVTVPTGTLDILKNDGTPLGAVDKHTTGAFVTVNDNDDGDQSDSDGNPIPDYQQTGSTDPNDPDLVKLVIEPIRPSEAPSGSYELSWASSDFQVWGDAAKSTPISSGTQFPTQTATSLYIEGQNVSPQQAAEEIDLSLNSAGKKFLLDWVKFTTGKISGANYLPAYGSYQYTLDGPLLAPTSTGWSAIGGAVSDSSPQVYTTGVSWNTPVSGTKAGDGWYGTVTYTPVPGFPVRLPVSVFSVNVTAPAAGAFQAGTPTDGGAPASYAKGDGNSPLSKFVSSGNPAGLTWQAQVAVNGPAKGVGHDNTGISKIQVGFIQNVKKGGYANDGTCANPNNPGQPLQRQSSSDTYFNTFGPVLDAGPGAGPTKPWYLSQFYYTDAQGKQQVQKAAWTPTIQAPNTVIGDSDQPNTGTPLDYAKDTTLAQVQASQQLLVSTTVLDQFELNVCAETVQADGNANLVYVREAKGDWSFNGSGTITTNGGAYAWASQLDPITNQNIAVVTAPAGWTPVTDGSSPVTTGMLGNDVIAAAKFE